MTRHHASRYDPSLGDSSWGRLKRGSLFASRTAISLIMVRHLPPNPISSLVGSLNVVDPLPNKYSWHLTLF
ncbi:hypothetical protein CPB86DRAFT_519939 [Serendipita vermifera]|nr:hypothetical protein CPB86DRAFT_519939 [Serendipita vermifera]